jgi:hypothetical protein
MEKQLTLEESNYRIRKTYLQAMKQSMADEQNAFQLQSSDDIEEYFLYEKEVSHHIQEHLEHSTLKTTHN